MYICYRCGEIREDYELSSYKECHGESCLGQSYEEELLDMDCSCGGEFVEAKQCIVCEEWFPADEQYGSVCEDCLNEEKTLENALIAGDLNRENLAINSFISYILGEDKINHILEEWVKENFRDCNGEVKHFLNLDKLWFSEFVEDKYKEKK